ncbi:hypothetical protein ACSSS7_008436 [Eimeria intestinalis]
MICMHAAIEASNPETPSPAGLVSSHTHNCRSSSSNCRAAVLFMGAPAARFELQPRDGSGVINRDTKIDMHASAHACMHRSSKLWLLQQQQQQQHQMLLLLLQQKPQLQVGRERIAAAAAATQKPSLPHISRVLSNLLTRNECGAFVCVLPLTATAAAARQQQQQQPASAAADLLMLLLLSCCCCK